jgi:hypothetical protein
VKDALDKTWLREEGRKDTLEQKARDKAANGKGKKTKMQDGLTSMVLDEVSQPKLASNRGTKQVSSY